MRDRDMALELEDRRYAGMIVVLFAMAGLIAVDLITDLRQGTTVSHVLVESLVIAIGLLAAGWLALRLRRISRIAQGLREHAAGLATDLHASQAEAARWRRDASALIAGLAGAIDVQLERWELSPAERDIALLLLKGLSHKEIATIREVSETTVRQQARAIYRKAGLSGRHDLAAFFLEDLLGPRPTARAAAS